MNKPTHGDPPASSRSDDLSRLAAMLLVRIVAAPAADRDVFRDVEPFRPARNHGSLEPIAAALVASGHLERRSDRLTATGLGRDAAHAFLGTSGEDDLASWPAVRDGALVLRALGLQSAAASRKKAAMRLDGLRALIVQSAWKLKASGRPSASRIRSQLAVVALERAFGNQIKAGLGKTALSPKAARILAGQLAKSPKQHATDARLIAQLAAEAAGVTRSDLSSLRRGLIRRFVAGETAAPAAKDRSRAATAAKAEVAAKPSVAQSPASPVAETATQPAVHSHRPTPQAFAMAVKNAAREKADGWTGNRKAFVSQVWSVIRDRHPGWGVSEIEFKSMLAEAHRMGLVVLANADLKDRRNIGEVEASAISYKNTIWHYVRVDE